jgi:hypothetical protein
MYQAESVGALSAGTYDAQIAKVEHQSYEGSEYINVQFKAQAGSAFEKFYTVHENPRAVSAGYGKMKQLAIACGWRPDDERKTLVRGQEEFTDPRVLQGERVQITVAEDRRGDKVYTNVKGFKAVTFGGAGEQQYARSPDDLSGGSVPYTGQF